uniref:G_PROTEIN_RECEP_F1_2 domain-containing protein n=2 Tax=Globodera pallida TaxID=36090 RepID=A0A183C061_GLOPA
MTTTATLSEVYLQLMKDDPRWTLIIFASIYTILAIFGIVMNFCVVYVTIRTKHFNNSANTLLAIYSFFELVHQSGHFLFAYNVFWGHDLMPSKIVIQILTPSYFAFSCTTFLLFFTSIDRLICVLFPLRHSNNIFVYGVVLPIVGTCGFLFVLLPNSEPVGDLLIAGSMNDVALDPHFSQSNYAFTMYSTLTFILLGTVAIYVLLAILLHFRKASSNSNSHQFNLRIFRSLFTIVCVNVGGYLLFDLLYFTIIMNEAIIPDLLTKWKWCQIVGILLNVSAASNAPILYFTSQEYRKAFDKELQMVVRIFSRNSVQPN